MVEMTDLELILDGTLFTESQAIINEMIERLDGDWAFFRTGQKLMLFRKK